MANKDIRARVQVDGAPARREFDMLGETGQRALAKIEKASKPASRGLLAVNAVSREGQALMLGYAGQTGILGAGLAALGPAGIAAAVGIAGLAAGLRSALAVTRQAIETVSQLVDTAEKLGLTTDQLQELRFAATQTGVATNTLDLAWQRFTRRIGEAQQGTGELLPVLKLYNIELRNQDGTARSIIDVYKDLADTVAKVRDPQEQLRIAFKAFDSEGAALINLLREAGDGLDRYGQKAHDTGAVFEHEFAVRLKEVGDELDALNHEMEVNQQNIAVQFADWLTGMQRAKNFLVQSIVDVKDIFADNEDRTARGLTIEANNLTAALDILRGRLDEYRKESAEALRRGVLQPGDARAPGGSVETDLQRRIADREKRLADIEGELARRKAATAGDGKSPLKVNITGGTVGTSESQKVIARLQQQLDALELPPVAAAFERALNDAGLRGEGLGNEQVQQILDLTVAIDDLTRAKKEQADETKAALKIKAEGKVLEKSLLTAEEAYQATLKETARLRAADAINAETEARANKAAERQKLDASREAADGMKRALRDIAAEAGNAAANAEQVWKRAFSGMEDAIVDFVKTGKLDFASLADSIISDLIRIQVRQQITGRIAGFFGDIFGGGAGGGAAPAASPASVQIAHAGGIAGDPAAPRRFVAPDLFAGAPRYHAGTPGAGLRRNEVAAVLERGEEVLTTRDPRHIRNGGGGVQVVTNTYITLQAGGNAVGPGGQIDPEMARALQVQFDRAADESVKKALEKQQRPRGMLNRGI